jgi:3-oxosteroid 1-dehydrogenase
MIQYLETKSRVRYAVAHKYPDYYQHLPGALPGGRSLDPELFDTSLLGDELKNLRTPSPSTLLMGRIAWTARDAHKAMAKERGWRLKIMGLMLRYQLDLRWRRKTRMDRRAGLGSALVCSLRRSLMDRNVPLWLKTDFQELVQEGGRVSGIVVDQGGQRRTLTAQGRDLRRRRFRAEPAAAREIPARPDPQQLERHPARLQHRRRADRRPGRRRGHRPAGMVLVGAHHRRAQGRKPRGVFAERAFPGAIVVNGLGRRFVNEAAPYLEFRTPCTRTTPPPAAVRSRPG